MNEKFAFRILTTVRRSYSTPTSTTRIYNTPVHSEVVKNWKPQTPAGPVHDGWALKRWPFRVGNHNTFFLKGLIFLCSGFWAPFLIVDYQLKKANSGK